MFFKTKEGNLTLYKNIAATIHNSLSWYIFGLFATTKWLWQTLLLNNRHTQFKSQNKDVHKKRFEENRGDNRRWIRWQSIFETLQEVFVVHRQFISKLFRSAEFNGNVDILAIERNISAYLNLRVLNLYDNHLTTLEVFSCVKLSIRHQMQFSGYRRPWHNTNRGN